ncbi:UNVERIFIED_CONTAM: hypothetical protein RMT77_008537 [Armadillidium vulgare]
MGDHSSWSLAINFDEKERHRYRIVDSQMKESERCEYLKAMLPVFWLAKVFGVLPLTIQKKEIRFKWISLSFIYWIIVIGLQMVYTILRITAAIYVECLDETWIDVAQDCFFYVLGISGSFLLLRLALRLPSLMRSFSELERNTDLKVSSKFKRKILLIMIVLMISAVGETISASFYKAQKRDQEISSKFLHKTLLRINEGIAKLVGHSDFMRISSTINTKIVTFIWNYLDLIISSIAIILTAIVKELNERLEKACIKFNKGQHINWISYKYLHMDIYLLNLEVDRAFGYLVLQSYLTNLSFILLQVYNGLQNIIAIEKGWGSNFSAVDSLYLAWSFLHLMGRLLLVTNCCCSLHHSSMEAYPSLLSLNVDRFSRHTDGIRNLTHQMERLIFGLTGAGFFLISKTFFVATVGALLTYEVILLQLNPKSPSSLNTTTTM